MNVEHYDFDAEIGGEFLIHIFNRTEIDETSYVYSHIYDRGEDDYNYIRIFLSKYHDELINGISHYTLVAIRWISCFLVDFERQLDTLCPDHLLLSKIGTPIFLPRRKSKYGTYRIAFNKQSLLIIMSLQNVAHYYVSGRLVFYYDSDYELCAVKIEKLTNEEYGVLYNERDYLSYNEKRLKRWLNDLTPVLHGDCSLRKLYEPKPLSVKPFQVESLPSNPESTYGQALKAYVEENVIYYDEDKIQIVDSTLKERGYYRDYEPWYSQFGYDDPDTGYYISFSYADGMVVCAEILLDNKQYELKVYFWGNQIVACREIDYPHYNYINYAGSESFKEIIDQFGDLYEKSLLALAGSRGGKFGENVTWRFDSCTNKLIIEGTGPMLYTLSHDSKYKIQTIVIGEGVTSIGARAFYHCDSLTSVSIPKSVTRIGNDAFAFCNSLTDVIIPDSVTIIGDGAFNGCSSLTSMTIPKGVTGIGASAFNGCIRLTSVTIPNSVSIIGRSAFCYCTGLTSIRIPKSVNIIEEGAFEFCTGIKEIQVETGNTAYKSLNGVLFTNDLKVLIQYPAGKKEEVYQVPKSVTKIGRYAFFQCTGLTSIRIPKSVNIIEEGAFEFCAGIKEIQVETGNTAYKSLNGVLFTNDLKVLIQYPAGKKDEVYQVPKSVTKIEHDAFRGSSYLTSIIIPNSVTYIADSCFPYNDHLILVVDRDSFSEDYCIGKNIRYICSDSSV